MMELWHRLRKRGYRGCPESLFRVMRRLGMFPESKPKKKYIPKPYRQMTYHRPNNFPMRPLHWFFPLEFLRFHTVQHL